MEREISQTDSELRDNGNIRKTSCICFTIIPLGEIVMRFSLSLIDGLILALRMNREYGYYYIHHYINKITAFRITALRTA